jgi:4-amino-4-deoxy-L-arabinose transferase-like glycosyltransferase
MDDSTEPRRVRSPSADAARFSLEQLVDRHGALLLFALAALVLLAGVGLRDPWPADEPRFAVIARDMLASGDWLIPHIGGALYVDKPPLYFWLLAIVIWLTGSVRVGFLLPSVVAGFVTIALVYDLARRLYDRTTAAWAGIVLLSTLQFAFEFKAAQIDPVLTMWTTLSLYALLRHLLLKPSWAWYAVGGFAAGLGIITKGVGFLPLLVLLPYAAFVRFGWPVRVRGFTWRWALAPLATAAAVSLWLVPMLVSTSASAELAAYRHEILFGQTIGRYAAAPGHWHAWWYFVGATIPWAWLPVSLALPWLVKPWLDAIRERDARIALPLAWIALVIVFFSLSSGKRGVYLLPAVPALALITAPYVVLLFSRERLHKLAWAVLLCAAVAAAATAVRFSISTPASWAAQLDGFTGSVAALLVPFAALAALALVRWPPRRGLTALGAFLVAAWPIYGWALWPQLDETRSGRFIMERTYAALPPGAELGVVAQKETLLLHARGPLTNFGHRRPDEEQERFDAARWLAEKPQRYLLIRSTARNDCFGNAAATIIGIASKERWELVPHSAAAPECAVRGDARNAIAYRAEDKGDIAVAIAPSTLERR